MATFQAGFSNSTVTLEVTENSYDVNSNTSSVHYKLYLTRNAGSLFGGADFNVVIDGVTRASGSNVSFSLSAGQSRVFAEADITIGHNPDGTKTISCSGFIDSGSGAATASGNLGLTNIPRYANITSVTLTPVTDESVTITWNADRACDYVSWWSSLIDGAAHHDTSINPASAGPFVVPLHNLTSGTNYDFYVAVRNQASGLWNSAGPYNATTLTQNNFMDFFDAV